MKKLRKNFLIVISMLLIIFQSNSVYAATSLSSEDIYNNTVNGKWSYVYDNSGRLSNALSPSGEVLEYKYDRNGNVLKRVKSDNLFLNPSFEAYTNSSGVADGWSEVVTSGTAMNKVVQMPLSSGISAQKIAGTGISKEHVVGIYQLIKVDANKSFISNGRLDIEFLKNATAQLYIEFYSDPNHIVSVYTTDYAQSTNGSFITLAINGSIPSNATFAKSYLEPKGMGRLEPFMLIL
ncbi:RHS repeat domain-containing protein [Paenibacillus typhae]|uniref:RHS repeat domain-containing protein n=1 Tax=Paenibacillus typhae TaxID=1174501 RepID=UPI001C8D22C0|nr:RHS repeat domain-containing protein [Paenibacillus typhae]MBY0014689.1 RHS repeat protein [Paenibacillus typhae]